MLRGIEIIGTSEDEVKQTKKLNNALNRTNSW